MARENKDGSYEDIIHLPHHSSKTHPRMSMLERAAQFSPFAALTGYNGVIRVSSRKIKFLSPAQKQRIIIASS